MEDTVRWSLKVSRETDEALRAYLGQTGGRKGDLSKFVQEAVRARLWRAKASARSAAPAGRARARAGLAEALREVRARTRKLSQARFEKLISEAVAYARRRR
ncbi:MAG: ribbon-helix-helix domain-containing protein [Burkholderiales bacterium]